MEGHEFLTFLYCQLSEGMGCVLNVSTLSESQVQSKLLGICFMSNDFTEEAGLTAVL